MTSNQVKLVSVILWTVAVCLACTSLAKIFSAMGNTKVLLESDPIFAIRIDSLFVIVGLLEFMLAILCVSRAETQVKAWSVLSFVFIASLYRFGLFWIDYKKPCSCLGDVADRIGLSDVAADRVLLGILCFFALGSGTILLICRRAGSWTQARIGLGNPSP